MFQWLGRLVCIALELERPGRAPVRQAVRHARLLLDSSQQRLPDGLGGALEQAVSALEAGAGTTARKALRAALEQARHRHLL